MEVSLMLNYRSDMLQNGEWRSIHTGALHRSQNPFNQIQRDTRTLFLVAEHYRCLKVKGLIAHWILITE